MPSILVQTRVGLAVAVCMLPLAHAAWSQVVGEAAELDRLRARAEEAIGNDDPDGAALSMGRAALMAKQLAKSHRDDPAAARLYQGAEPLFRAQEHSYRAMALFRRAGGQLPASSGVCGSLSLAQGSLQQALSLLVPDEQAPADVREHTKKLRETADDWVTVIASMIGDYECP